MTGFAPFWLGCWSTGRPIRLGIERRVEISRCQPATALGYLSQLPGTTPAASHPCGISPATLAGDLSGSERTRQAGAWPQGHFGEQGTRCRLEGSTELRSGVCICPIGRSVRLSTKTDTGRPSAITPLALLAPLASEQAGTDVPGPAGL